MEQAKRIQGVGGGFRGQSIVFNAQKEGERDKAEKRLNDRCWRCVINAENNKEIKRKERSVDVKVKPARVFDL